MTAQRPRAKPDTGLALYTVAAGRSSARVIGAYSTSFGMASTLLHKRLRPDVHNIYGLVRVADEIVDGAAREAGLDLTAQRAQLDGLEAETLAAMRSGYSTNLIVHAFAITARTHGIGHELVTPFFASMRRDLSPVDFSTEELSEYIYGSAEVVGLMCLKVFLHESAVTDEQRTRLEHGARRLGAAFQKINFLRDLSADWEALGRNYFPTLDPAHMSEPQKEELIDDIDADLDAAAAVIPELPRGCRSAIAAAHGLFSGLTRRLRATPAADLLHRRTRINNVAKFGILLSTANGRVVRSAR